jgi:hypothetical protein
LRISDVLRWQGGHSDCNGDSLLTTKIAVKDLKARLNKVKKSPGMNQDDSQAEEAFL